jgi:hypothetical protein
MVIDELVRRLKTLKLRTVAEGGAWVVSIRGDDVDLSAQGSNREQALERIALQGAAELQFATAQSLAMKEALVEARPYIAAKHKYGSPKSSPRSTPPLTKASPEM